MDGCDADDLGKALPNISVAISDYSHRARALWEFDIGNGDTYTAATELLRHNKADTMLI